ncbi:MAG: methyltransferase, partial [Pseudomonadota bacterium]
GRLARWAGAGRLARWAGAGRLARWADAWRRWRDARIADPDFQAWAARSPLTRPVVRRQSAALYDLVAGFVYSQVLYAVVELDLCQRLAGGAKTTDALAAELGWPVDGVQRLCQAAAALDLLARLGDGRYGLGPLGPVLIGAPGVAEMVRHHNLLYRDLADPTALLSGRVKETALSRFWAYVAEDEGAAAPAGTAAAYSRLMAASQTMVAAETLATGALRGVRHLLDVGGGEGAFLAAALRADPRLRGTVFDLAPVAGLAKTRLGEAGLAARSAVVGGSFRTDHWPKGADAISLIRVLYDHSDSTVAALLASAFAALPPGGRIVISEPMSGGTRPTREGDAYFGLYTAAMTSGTPRALATHRTALEAAGFQRIRALPAHQKVITRVVVGYKPSA